LIENQDKYFEEN